MALLAEVLERNADVISLSSKRATSLALAPLVTGSRGPLTSGWGGREVTPDAPGSTFSPGVENPYPYSLGLHLGLILTSWHPVGNGRLSSWPQVNEGI
jgi:hypothetical protein